MKLYKVTNNLVDCFLGDGWENWSRWKLQQGLVKQVGGHVVPPFIKTLIASALKDKK